MPVDPKQTIYYKRARFTTRLPLGRLYDQSHFWLLAEEEDLYRIGLTKFATRMLGDLVEINFNASVGDEVDVGQTIGSIEGFKAISELYCTVQGQFESINQQLSEDPSLLDRDPYDAGWLYRVRGKPSETTMEIQGYISVLDATVDKMLDYESSQSKGSQC